MKIAFAIVIVISMLWSCNDNNIRQIDSSKPPMISNKDSSQKIMVTEGFEKEKKILHGRWQNEEDAKSILIFADAVYLDKYDDSPADTFEYSISHFSCDEYDKNNSPDSSLYLSSRNYRNVKLCYEITNLGSETLALMYLSNGKIFTYRRVK